jgi:hypothetical protein
VASANAATSGGSSGSVTLSTGAATSGTSGSVALSVGLGSTGGDIQLTGGQGRVNGGGDVSLTAGNGANNVGGDVVIQGGDSTAGTSSSSSGGDVSLTTGAAGSLYMTVGMGSVSSSDVTDSSASINFGYNSASGTNYDFRLQHTASGDSSAVANMPVRLTVVDYSSDIRIKRQLSEADTDELLQRIQQVEYKRYRYTDPWRKVRRIDDVEVRGVIAQQLAEVFPEHVTILDEYTLPDKNFTLPGFHQVNKQGLTLDLLGAMQAQHRRFKIEANSNDKSGDVRVSSADAGDYVGAGQLGNSGAVTVSSGASEHGTTGKITLQTGVTNVADSGDVIITSGSSTAAGSGSLTLETGDGHTSSGVIDMRTGHTETAPTGGIHVQVGASQFDQGGNAVIQAGNGRTGPARGVLTAPIIGGSRS